MLRLLDDKAPELVEFEVDGETMSAPAGISVAAAVLYLDLLPLRHSAVSAAPRAPLCMMGACFECQIEIDGLPNQRACQVELRAGMRLRRQLVER